MRLFLAVSPPPDVRQRLGSAADALRAQGSGKSTEPENLHLTLVFLGETNRAEVAVSAISSLTAAPFTMAAASPGCFGDVYWLGMQLSPELSVLQKEAQNRLQEADFTLETREFIPHVTLARRFSPNKDLDLTLVEKAAGDLLWPVNTVTLMESQQKNGKTVYVPLYVKELSGE